MILIVQSLWNEAITSKLVEGASRILKEKKVPFQVVQVPGALEIPLAVVLEKKKQKAKLQGVIACGTVVKGDTYHFEIVANESARALTQLSIDYLLPIGNAILTTYTVDQALERAGGKVGNKGEEGAHTVLQMLELMKAKRKRS